MMGLNCRETVERRGDNVARVALLEAVEKVEGYAREHRANAKADAAREGNYPGPGDLEECAQACEHAARKLRGWADALGAANETYGEGADATRYTVEDPARYEGGER